MYRFGRGMGDAPYDNCPAGTSLFGNPPTCVTDAIVNQAGANIQAKTQGTCPPGFLLIGNPPICSPMGAGGGSPCDIGNVFLDGSCYPAGSTLSGGTVTQPDGTQVDASTGQVIGSYDWAVAHGGGSTVSTGPQSSPASAPPPASQSNPASAAPPAQQSNPASQAPSTNVIVSSQPPAPTNPPSTSGFSLSSIPTWGWLAIAGIGFLAFSKH